MEEAINKYEVNINSYNDVNKNLIRERKETDIEDLGSIHFINDTLVAELIKNQTINILHKLFLYKV